MTWKEGLTGNVCDCSSQTEYRVSLNMNPRVVLRKVQWIIAAAFCGIKEGHLTDYTRDSFVLLWFKEKWALPYWNSSRGAVRVLGMSLVTDPWQRQLSHTKPSTEHWEPAAFSGNFCLLCVLYIFTSHYFKNWNYQILGENKRLISQSEQIKRGAGFRTLSRD